MSLYLTPAYWIVLVAALAFLVGWWLFFRLVVDSEPGLGMTGCYVALVVFFTFAVLMALFLEVQR